MNPVARRGSSGILFGCAIGVALLGGSFALPALAGQARTANDGVYTGEQAGRGQAMYKDRCSTCHGPTLGGAAAPPLAGADFIRIWSAQPLSGLVDKIQHTMPANDFGKLTRQQSADLVAYILQVGRFPAGRTELGIDDAAPPIALLAPQTAQSGQQPVVPGPQPRAFPPLANLAQMMRGMLFPTSNLIFNVQGRDPGEPRAAFKQGAGGFSWVDWGADIYPPWDLVDYAALAIAESAPLMLTPGRRCENGKPVPVDRADWVKYTLELVEAGKAAYKASQTRNQETVSAVTDQIAESCLNCHMVYRDKPGRSAADPSNKAARCMP